MPVGEYFKGHGREVMADMVRRHGKKKGKRIFYATANKRGLTPGDKHNAIKSMIGGR